MVLRIAFLCVLVFTSSEAKANEDVINLFGNIVSEVLESQDNPRVNEDIDWNDSANHDAVSRDDGREAQHSSTIILVQKSLKKLGYYHGAIDGISGNGTTQAILQWQSDNGFTPDGQLSKEQIERLTSFSNFSKEKGDLCISSLCIGMTIAEVLRQKASFKDGRISRNEEQAEMRKMLENHYGKQRVSREFNKLGGLPTYQGDPDSKKMKNIRNLSAEERAYLSTFYPDRGHRASLDARALSLLEKATVCAYFQVSATAIMNDGRSIDVRFLPLGENFELIIVRMIRDYEYFGVERDVFKENVFSEYDGFHVSLDAYAEDRPDIVLSMGERHQSLILLHPDWWNVAGFASKGMYAKAEKYFNEVLHGQDGCYKKEAPI